jgi:hypothetical protein
VPVIIWLNGGFGAGKRTLAEELHRRVPDAGVLRERLKARVGAPVNLGANQSAQEWALSRVDAAAIAASRQPGGTLMLRSDQLTPVELADEVLAAASVRPAD